MADVVKQVENACAIAMGALHADVETRKRAQDSVVALGASLDSMGVIQAVLGSSSSDPAITACAQALQRICTEHWNVLSDAMRVEMKTYILNILATKGPSMQPYAIKALVQLLCRIIKYAWFDETSEQIRSIVKDAEKFLQVTVQHCTIGLRILNELVTEMNQKNKNRTLTQHRKVAISFRDTCLLDVFEATLSMLNTCATCAIQTSALPPAEAARMESSILNESLQLLINCLSFDFLGVNPDESVEENAVLQVPNSWRDRIQSGATLRLLFNVYRGCTTGKIPLIVDAAPPNPADAAASAAAMQQPTQPFRLSAEHASHTLEAVTMLISVRRSLFATDADRKRFLTHTIRGVNDILREKAGLGDSNCYHALARLLSKIKNNFQLTEMAKCDGYGEWLSLVSAFTQEACSKLAWASNSMHYILAVWAKLVAAVPYAKLEAGPAAPSSSAAGGAGGMPGSVSDPLMLDTHIPAIVGAYVRGRMDSLVGPDADEALEALMDMEGLEEELEHVAALIRYQYDTTSTVMASVLDPLMEQYEKGLALIEANSMALLTGSMSKDVVVQVRLLECKLAWLVAITGPVVGQTANSGTAGSILSGLMGSTAAGDEAFDAELSMRVLKLMNVLDRRLANAANLVRSVPNPAMHKPIMDLFKPDVRLELAILLFVDSFKKAYISEASGMPAPAPPAPPATAAASGASAALLLSAVKPAAQGKEGSGGDSGMGGGESASTGVTKYDPTDYDTLMQGATGRQKAFINMFVRMNLGNHIVVIGVILGKLANNLRYWADSDPVIKASLNVFHELVFGYTSGKLLLSMEQVSTLLVNHGPEAFPFLAVPSNSRYRTKFYTCLARIVFLEEDSERLEPFMGVIVSSLDRLAPAVQNRNDEVMRALIGAARDLRGIVAAAQGRGAYIQLFDILHPKHLNTMIRALEVWSDVPSVSIPILRFFVELCSQRGGRIAFGTNSPNGILLFRAASQAITTWAGRMAAYQPRAGEDKYKLKYKAIMLLTSLLNRCLDGSFVNFGVFQLYGDAAADSSLQAVLDLLASMPASEVLQHTKLGLQAMILLHFVCRSHMDSFTALPPHRFAHFTGLLREGLDHVDAEISTHAASAWDYIGSTYVKLGRKETPGARALRGQIQQQPGFFEMLMKMLFQIIVFSESSAQWSVMRALLPAILAAEMTSKDVLESFKAELVSSQPGSLQPRMSDEFNKLCADVTRSLDMGNRDRFAQRLAMFRTTVREFAAV